MSFNTAIAKRGMRLGIMYVALSFFLAVLGIILSAVGALVPGNLPAQGAPVDVNAYISLIPVPLVAMGGLMAATPVSLLFVHDKENGTLEYLLSMGFDQRDVFRAYLAASLLLGLAPLVVGGAATSAVAIDQGRGAGMAATILACSLALGFAAVALVAVLMSAFGALQRQPMGMNQPLGIAIGALAIIAAMIAPSTMPALQVILELAISAILSIVSVALLALTPKLIRREQMLP